MAMKQDQVTGDQFDVLTTLLRGTPDSPANQAARAVLVDGMSQAEAMRATGATRSTVGDAVKRYRTADDAIRRAYLHTGKHK
nr:TrfB-related DNA-binding protein [Paraburkholderia sp. BL8N3]